jgi:hypothetical protein
MSGKRCFFTGLTREQGRYRRYLGSAEGILGLGVGRSALVHTRVSYVLRLYGIRPNRLKLTSKKKKKKKLETFSV